MLTKRRIVTTCIAAAVLSLLAGGGIAGQLPPGTDSVDSAAPGPQGSRGSGSTAHGAYLDYGPAGVSRMADLSRWLGGAELRVGHTYLPGDLWVNIEGTPDFLDAWADWRKADEDRMFVLNVPMLERNEERVPDAQVRRLLRSGAAGDYDQHFTRLAERLVSLGVPDTVIVLGWEMNGTTYTHRCGPDPASWKAYWQRIVTAMRAVPGQEFRFDFTPSRGRDAVPWTDCYPGTTSSTSSGWTPTTSRRASPSTTRSTIRTASRSTSTSRRSAASRSRSRSGGSSATVTIRSTCAGCSTGSTGTSRCTRRSRTIARTGCGSARAIRAPRRCSGRSSPTWPPR